MNKVEKYIEQHTRRGSNRIIHAEEQTFTDMPTLNKCHSWLTPNDAREVAKIAGEEVIERACGWLQSELVFYHKYHNVSDIDMDTLINDFRKEMKR